MTEHSEIMTEMQFQLENYSDAVLVMPSALAMATYNAIASGEDESRLTQYLSLEALKGMARKLLARKFKADEGDDSVAYQGELFSGALQPRYPLPRVSGEEPVYKRREDLTAQERAWNAEQLRKSGQARLEHADALEAEGDLQAAS